MTHSDIILEYLDEARPGGVCDDCLSKATSIRPRQQVNQLCRRLSDQALVHRLPGKCETCGRRKTVNSEAAAGGASAGTSPVRPERGLEPAPSRSSARDLDIEKLRTQIVHICHTVWKGTRGDAAPRSVSAAICLLKEESHLPRHVANMMLTLCNLRNVYVYERLPMGEDEERVATGAWGIVQRWWDGARGRFLGN